MAFNVAGLTAYVDQTKLELIGKSVLSAKTTKLVNLQVGVKGSAAINLLNSTTYFQDGSACGFTASGSTSLTQRKIETGIVKINKTYCDKDLRNYWANYEVKIAAGTAQLPFEQMIIDQEIENVGSNLETLVWQGDTNDGDLFDGYLTILTAASGSTVNGNTGNYTAITTSNVVAIIDAVYSVIPEEILDKKDTVVFVGADTFRKYTIALKNANMYNYVANSTELANQELLIPGTLIKMIAVNGLNSTNRIVAGQLSNFYYGTDLQGDEEKFDLWFSKDNQDFRLAIQFNSGCQIAFPDMIVDFVLE
jgi:hypothetical protein